MVICIYPCPAELSPGIFHSFEAGIAKTTNFGYYFSTMSVDRNDKSMSGSSNSLTKVTPSEDFKITDQKKRQKDVENGITVLSWNSIHSDSPPEKVEGGVTKGSVLDPGQKNVDENEEEGCCGPAGQPAWKVTVNILLIILAGIIFGWSMEKSRGQQNFFIHARQTRDVEPMLF